MNIIGVAPEKVSKGISPKKLLIIAQVALGILILGAIAGGYYIVNHYLEMQKKSDSLIQLSAYSNKGGAVTQEQLLKDQQTKSTIPEIADLYLSIENKRQQLDTYYQNIQVPYTDFLQYFLLPPLNIWRDKYTGKIDATLLGEKYLKDNAYLDVNLISQRTDFFKNIGADSPKNDIKSINVGSIVERQGGLFSMPIDVDFSSQTKRSFLLLVDKVSMTSNRQNLSLINEFFFNLWYVLKTKESPSEEKSIDQPALDGASSGDVVSLGSGGREIGEKLYKWIYDDSNTYVADADIAETVRRTANCEEGESSSVCYFRFREKMRSLPTLAYTVGLDNSNKVKELRTFIRNMPPLINVLSFTFQRGTNNGYEGRISIEVYGKSISPEEVSQIASHLGAECTNNVALNPMVAIAQLDTTIKQAQSISEISNEKSKQLTDLKQAFVRIGESYDSLPGFKKVVKLFEMYRMLKENRMCIKR